MMIIQTNVQCDICERPIGDDDFFGACRSCERGMRCLFQSAVDVCKQLIAATDANDLEELKSSVAAARSVLTAVAA